MKKKARPIQIARAVAQLAAFAFAPALFITVFAALGGAVTSIVGGSFVLSENAGRLALLLAVFLATAIFGRYFCGFICSFGAMQDLLNALGGLIPFKVRIPEKADKRLKLLKYAVLAFIVVGVWGFSATGDLLWSPWTVFGVYTKPDAWSSLRSFLTLGGAFLLLIIVGSMFVERFFCKYLCPLGALFALASRHRLFPIKRRAEKCGSCRLCSAKCSMSIPLYKLEKVSSGECVNCMKCVENCPNENISAETLPAISGVVAAAAVAGLYYAGVLSSDPDTKAESDYDLSSVEATGYYSDGVYSGTGKGFRGDTKVTVKVENGVISDITVDSYKDDEKFFARAESGIVSAVIASQSPDVDAVSGATYSSKGLIEAIKDALDDGTVSKEESSSGESSERETSEPATGKKKKRGKRDKEEWTSSEPETEGTSASENEDAPSGGYADGVYTGTGTGFRGETKVTVAVENGEIADITIDSYRDDKKYFSRAESGVISAILQSQSPDVDAVSGATFSSNGIKEAVADALGIEFGNPNDSGGGHGGNRRR